MLQVRMANANPAATQQTGEPTAQSRGVGGLPERVTVTVVPQTIFYFLKNFFMVYGIDCQPARNTLLCSHDVLLTAVYT